MLCFAVRPTYAPAGPAEANILFEEVYMRWSFGSTALLIALAAGTNAMAAEPADPAFGAQVDRKVMGHVGPERRRHHGPEAAGT